jgi:RIO-like serine/threonine protein kinase
MLVAKKYSTKLSAVNWCEHCQRENPESKILIFRDLSKVCLYYVGELNYKTDENFVLACGLILPRWKFTICNYF